MHCYSRFWLDYAAGRIRLASAWHDDTVTDRPTDPAPHAPGAIVPPAEMAAWLGLSDIQRLAIVDGYSVECGRTWRPTISTAQYVRPSRRKAPIDA